MTQGKSKDGQSTGNNGPSKGGKAKGIANLRPWQPGQSGNPSGRPVMPPEVKAALEAGSEAAARRLVELVGSNDERVALLASQALLDRLYGKPAQAVDKTITTTTVQQQHLAILVELQARRDQAVKTIEGHTQKVEVDDPAFLKK